MNEVSSDSTFLPSKSVAINWRQYCLLRCAGAVGSVATAGATVGHLVKYFVTKAEPGPDYTACASKDGQRGSTLPPSHPIIGLATVSVLPQFSVYHVRSMSVAAGIVPWQCDIPELHYASWSAVGNADGGGTGKVSRRPLSCSP